jgi:antitoxin PrlF
MNELTVSAKGQVTLRKDLLTHLGVQRGGKIAVHKLADGRIEIRAARSTARFRISLIFSRARTVVPYRLSKSMKSPDGAGPVSDENYSRYQHSCSGHDGG